MQEFLLITGGSSLKGEVVIEGAKNAALPILISSILCDGILNLSNVPQLVDIKYTIDILSNLGIQITQKGTSVRLDASVVDKYESSYDLGSKLRASMLILGPLLSRFGQAKVSLPGGCSIGMRPIDLHLSLLEKMGAIIEIDHGYMVAHTNGKLKGIDFTFSKVSVGATQTAIMSACLAEGKSRFVNVAREPEIIDLIKCLRAMGAKISGEGTSVIEIEGVEKLSSASYQVVADRIEAGSYAIAALATFGDVTLCNVEHNIFGDFFDYLEKAGAKISYIDNDKIRVQSTGKVTALDITTLPYPSFPTDLQSPWTSLMCIAEGKSIILETIFENRFTYVPELQRMGASINVLSGREAVIEGVKHLTSAEVKATDLRASFALIIAGLVANGQTVMRELDHLHRGYVDAVGKLTKLGATIIKGEK